MRQPGYYLPPGIPELLRCGAIALLENLGEIALERKPSDVSEFHAHGHRNPWAWYKLSSEWAKSRVADRPIEPAYRKFSVRSGFIRGITCAEPQFDSVYGIIAVGWRCENKQITVDLTVPANTTALLTLPETEGVDLVTLCISPGIQSGFARCIF
ncbi:MAG: alpha-L-rhamnosidase C-terminal domain-containing protein [Faecousia sp.]